MSTFTAYMATRGECGSYLGSRELRASSSCCSFSALMISAPSRQKSTWWSSLHMEHFTSCFRHGPECALKHLPSWHKPNLALISILLSYGRSIPQILGRSHSNVSQKGHRVTLSLDLGLLKFLPIWTFDLSGLSCRLTEPLEWGLPLWRASDRSLDICRPRGRETRSWIRCCLGGEWSETSPGPTLLNPESNTFPILSAISDVFLLSSSSFLIIASNLGVCAAGTLEGGTEVDVLTNCSFFCAF